MVKIEANTDRSFLMNGIPYQKGQYEISPLSDETQIKIVRVGSDTVVTKAALTDWRDAGDLPFADFAAFVAYTEPFFFRSVAGGGGGSVDSVFGRTGAVTAQSGDYNSTQITNSSLVTGVDVTTALNAIWEEVTETASTGVVGGMLLTVDVGGLTYSIDAGKYDIVKDSLPDEIEHIVYVGSAGNSLPSLAVDTQYYVFIDENEVLTYQETAPLPNDYKEKVLIGALIVVGGVIVNFSNLQVPVTNLAWRIKNLTNAIGLINARDNRISNGSTNLSIAKTQGYLYTYRDGRDGIDQGSFVDSVAFNSNGVDRFTLVKQTGITNPTAQFLDVGNYDLGGVITPIGGGSGASANWFVYLFPDTIVVVYPQAFYSTLTEAEQNIDKDAQNLIIPDLFQTSGFPLGVFTVNKTATDLSDTTKTLFRNGSKFGEFVGGSGASAVGLVKESAISTSSFNNGVDLAGNTYYSVDVSLPSVIIGDNPRVYISQELISAALGAGVRLSEVLYTIPSNGVVRVYVNISSFLSGNTNFKGYAEIIK